MAVIPNDEQFVGISPDVDLTEKSSTQTNDKRTIYTYAELFGESDVQLETGSTGQFAGVSKLPQTYNVGGVQYDSYNLKCWATLTPQATAHVVSIGTVVVDFGNIFFIKNRSNVEAVDFNGFGGYTITPLTDGAMVDDATDVARPISGVFYANQENIPTFPVEFNAMYIVAADAADFECDAYVDIDFIVEAGNTVTFTIA
tara:strand:+ start:3756 stop:4355 length:600 start_codon:yes stop_codon:yes gene_type:complete